MSDETWKTVFEVRQKEIVGTDEADLLLAVHTYDVVNLYNGEIVGNYRDKQYARKQAKRKYKKLIKLMEKNFMGVEVS